jgi:aldose 1-epimerase
MKVTSKSMGMIPEKGELICYTVENSAGMSVEIVNLGAIIQSINLTTKDERRVNVVFGESTLEGYSGRPMQVAYCIGRCANRIADGRFTAGGKTYQLEGARNGVLLHSGAANYGAKLFTGKIVDFGNKAGVTFFYNDNGEGGYENNCAVWITITLSEDCAVELHYYAVADGDTCINMTNHAYFNLNGRDSDSVLDQTLKLDAKYYTPINEKLLPSGEILKVAGTPLDFTTGPSFRQAMDSDAAEGPFRASGFDHNFVLEGSGYRKVAESGCAESGITMETYTDLPGMQLFMPGSLLPPDPNRRMPFKLGAAFCLETQYFPNSVNIPHFPSPIRLKGEPFESTTVYKFTVAK